MLRDAHAPRALRARSRCCCSSRTTSRSARAACTPSRTSPRARERPRAPAGRRCASRASRARALSRASSLSPRARAVAVVARASEPARPFIRARALRYGLNGVGLRRADAGLLADHLERGARGATRPPLCRGGHARALSAAGRSGRAARTGTKSSSTAAGGPSRPKLGARERRRSPPSAQPLRARRRELRGRQRRAAVLGAAMLGLSRDWTRPGARRNANARSVALVGTRARAFFSPTPFSSTKRPLNPNNVLPRGARAREDELFHVEECAHDDVWPCARRRRRRPRRREGVRVRDLAQGHAGGVRVAALPRVPARRRPWHGARERHERAWAAGRAARGRAKYVRRTNACPQNRERPHGPSPSHTHTHTHVAHTHTHTRAHTHTHTRTHTHTPRTHAHHTHTHTRAVVEQARAALAASRDWSRGIARAASMRQLASDGAGGARAGVSSGGVDREHADRARARAPSARLLVQCVVARFRSARARRGRRSSPARVVLTAVSAASERSLPRDLRVRAVAEAVPKCVVCASLQRRARPPRTTRASRRARRRVRRRSRARALERAAEHGRAERVRRPRVLHRRPAERVNGRATRRPSVAFVRANAPMGLVLCLGRPRLMSRSTAVPRSRPRSTHLVEPHVLAPPRHVRACGTQSPRGTQEVRRARTRTSDARELRRGRRRAVTQEGLVDPALGAVCACTAAPSRCALARRGERQLTRSSRLRPAALTVTRTCTPAGELAWSLASSLGRGKISWPRRWKFALPPPVASVTTRVSRTTLTRREIRRSGHGLKRPPVSKARVARSLCRARRPTRTRAQRAAGDRWTAGQDLLQQPLGRDAGLVEVRRVKGAERRRGGASRSTR